MRLLSRQELRELMQGSEELRISIFMPTQKAGKEVKQNAIRFKNLLRRAEERVQQSRRLRPSQAAALLKPAHDLVDEAPFWNHQQEGLALFLSSELFRHYSLPIRFQELVVVDRSFHLKPLLRLFTVEGRFYVLTLSRMQVKLYDCKSYTIRELELRETPTSFVDVVGPQAGERHLQWHTGTAARRGQRAAHFHGQGGAERDLKPEIRKFLAGVDRGVRKALPDEQAPLVLVGVEDLLPIYREVSSYPALVADDVRVNPASLRAEELRDRAWAAAEPELTRGRRLAEQRIRELLGTGRASNALEEIVRSAGAGRAEVLFVPRGVQQWGTFDAESQRVVLEDGPRNGNRDLLDFAAVQTILNGGRVYVVDPAELPGDAGRAAALFRH